MQAGTSQTSLRTKQVSVETYRSPVLQSRLESIFFSLNISPEVKFTVACYKNPPVLLSVYL